MTNPKRRARELWRAIEQWTPDSSWHVEIDTPGITPKGLAEALVVRNGEPWVRLGFAVRERLIAAARLNELLSTVEQFWPDLESWAENQRRKLETGVNSTRIPGFPLNSGEPWEVMLDMVQAIEDGEADVVDRSLSMDPEVSEQWVSRLADYREARALEELFRQRGRYFESPIRAATEGLPIDQGIAEPSELGEVMQWAMSNYLPAEWLFSWVADDQQTPQQELYGTLFEMRRVMRDVTELDNLFGSIANSIEIGSEEYRNASSIIRRLWESIAELGYEGVIQAVTSNGGQSGANSMLGNTSPINLIPGKPFNLCCPIVVAMANNSLSSRKTKFRQIMRDLRAHLIHCARQSKLAIMVTDVWNSKLIEESRQDILAHQENGLQLVVLRAAGNTLTHLPVDLKAR